MIMTHATNVVKEIDAARARTGKNVRYRIATSAGKIFIFQGFLQALC